MDAVHERYTPQLPIELVVGGLRPGNTERFDEQRRDYILGHWKAVHERTGQPFNFEFRMKPGFIYDTEPASRAVVTVRSLRPDLAFPVFREIQRAFYVDNRDVTQEAVLADIAHAHGIEHATFLASFHDPETKKQEWREFEQCRELGITGFPSLLGKKGRAFTSITHGYIPFNVLATQIDEWLTSLTTGSSA